MKRSTFFYVAFRIVFTTVVTSNLTLKLAAHDLPSDARFFNHARIAATKKVTLDLPQVPEQVADRSVPTNTIRICQLADWANVPSSNGIPSDNSHVAFQSGLLVPAISPMYKAPTSRSRPTEATLPTPKRKQFDENYLPYDLSMRDWRHREFSSRTNAHLVDRSIARPTPGQTVSKRGLSDRLLCSVRAQVAHFGSQIQKSLSNLNVSNPRHLGQRLGQASLLLGSIQKNLANQSSAFLNESWGPNLQPFFRSPQLVNITLPDGHPLLVSLQTARSLGVILESQSKQPVDSALPTHHLLDTEVAKIMTSYMFELAFNYQACFNSSLRSLALAMDINRVQRIALSEAPIR
ncbi:MAG: hypothetical protein AAGG44_16875 [Planctomycetota bacterium]